MGRTNTSAQKLQQFARVVASGNNGSRRPAQLKPISKARPISSTDPISESHQLRLQIRQMEAAESSERQRRMPLAEVVSDCVKRWFQDTLKEAKNGDIGMQVLVGQMYASGYGVAKDVHKGRAWINRAARSRSSALGVGDKHPGYNVSDSDSDDANEDVK